MAQINNLNHNDSSHYSDDHNHYEEQSHHAREPSAIRTDGMMPGQAQYPQQQQRPINEAVTSAFDKAETASYVPPELIAQITQSVINQLKKSGTENTTPVPPPHAQSQFPPPPPTAIHNPIPQSPSTLSASSPPASHRGVYTPPTPQKPGDIPSHGSPQAQSTPFPGPPQSPTRDAPTAHFHERTTSPFSQSSEPSHSRPRGPTRLGTGLEETTLERMWGQLFDEQGHSTVRLSQFLRGLAVHLIEDYEPRHSLVVTPKKMVRYYQEVKLDEELYPWSTVFDDEQCYLSRMYRELACQHHLVQERNDIRPDIAGLTPIGFERWTTLLIQAHPEEEFERLAKAVLAMPINNADDKKERFPKELSRRLFPTSGDNEIRERLEEAMVEHGRIDLPRKQKPSLSKHSSHSDLEQPEPKRANAAPEQPIYIPPNYQKEPREVREASIHVEPATPTPTPVPNSHVSQIERERAPYANTPLEAVIDDTNPYPPPNQGQPIERERKPYVSMPGGGKSHDEEEKNTIKEPQRPRAESMHNGPPPPIKLGRSESSARNRPVPGNFNAPRPTDIPKPEIHHHRMPSNARRQRSPSFSRGGASDYRRSDSDIRGYPPPSYQPSSTTPADTQDDFTTRYMQDKADRRARRQAEEDARMFSGSPGSVRQPDPRRQSYHPSDHDYYRDARGVPGNGYDYSQQPHNGSQYR